MTKVSFRHGWRVGAAVILLSLLLITSAFSVVPDVERIHGLSTHAKLLEYIERSTGTSGPKDAFTILWGPILAERLSPKPGYLDPSITLAGWDVVEQYSDRNDPDVWSLIAWWYDRIARHQWPEKMMTFRQGKAPVEENTVDPRLAATVKAAVQERLVANDGGDFSKMLRWWYQARPKEGRRVRPVEDAEVAAIANNNASPFRLFAIAEMAWRERRRKQEGPWTQRWAAIKARTPQNVAVQALVKEERYLIEKGRL